MICNKCWGDAYMRSLDTGKSQTECYCELLEERKDNPCSIEEQGCRKCGYDELAGENIDGKMVIRCCNCGWVIQPEHE